MKYLRRRRVPLECVYCGSEAQSQDHIRPTSRRGTNDPSNLVPSCQRCNSSKGGRLLTEWDPVRVARGVMADARVRAEWDRLVLLQKLNPIVPYFRQRDGAPPARASAEPPRREPVNLACGRPKCGQVWLTTAKGGISVKCPNCGASKKVPVGARR